MTSNDAVSELNEELEEIILAAVRAQDALNESHLTAEECADWASLVYQFNQSFGFMYMHMLSPHRSKEFH